MKFINEDYILNGVIACPKFISANHRYSSEENTRDYKRELECIRTSLEKSGLVEGCLSESSYSLRIFFFLKEDIDLDNIMKAPIDIISQYLGFDDRCLKENYSRKMVMPELRGIGLEFAYFELSDYYDNELSVPYKELREFVRKKTGHDVLRILANKLGFKRKAT